VALSVQAFAIRTRSASQLKARPLADRHGVR